MTQLWMAHGGNPKIRRTKWWIALWANSGSMADKKNTAIYRKISYKMSHT